MLPDSSRQYQSQQGFTLIEVMVALTILAIVAVIAMQASGTYLRSVENLKTRTFAHFIAQNTAAGLQISARGQDLSLERGLSHQQIEQTNTVTEFGRQWQVAIRTAKPADMPNAQAAGLYSSLQPLVQPVNIQITPMHPATEEGGDGQLAAHSITDLTILIRLAPNL